MHPVEREEREEQRDEHDAERLAALAQPEVPAGADAEVVVDEADEREPDDQDEQRPPGARELDVGPPEVRDEVADDDRADDREATHRRRPGLVHVRVLDRPVVADLLADAALAQRSDHERRAEDRDEERRRRRHEHRDQVIASCVGRAIK